MSPSAGRAGPVGLLAALLATPVHGGARLQVSGEVVSAAPRLEVRVVVSNRGDRPAAPLEVVGELGQETRRARVGGGVAPGQAAAVVLDFGTGDLRPGRHVLALLLEHPGGGAPDAAGNPPVESQRAFLVVALGDRPGPAVRLEPGSLSVHVRGELPVTLESLDGKGHRVRLRALTARGLRAPGPAPVVAVPARGAVSAAVTVVRSGGRRGSRHGVLILAEALDGDRARTAVATATVDVAPDPALLPRLHGLLLAVSLALLAGAVLGEVRRRRPA